MQPPRAGFPAGAQPLHTRLPPVRGRAPQSRPRQRVIHWNGDGAAPTAVMRRPAPPNPAGTAAADTKAAWCAGTLELWGRNGNDLVESIGAIVKARERATCRLDLVRDRVRWPARGRLWTDVVWCPAGAAPEPAPQPAAEAPAPPVVHLPFAQLTPEQRRERIRQAVESIKAEGKLPPTKDYPWDACEREVMARCGAKPDDKGFSERTLRGLFKPPERTTAKSLKLRRGTKPPNPRRKPRNPG